MTGGWNFIIAAYIAAAVLLGGYSISLMARLRRERQVARERDARHAGDAGPGPGGASTR
ncbi:MAG: hypothetical protein PVH00_08440 [Gemmatimonadota bacterium]|jgi:hypothetical protein